MNENVELNINNHVILVITLKSHLAQHSKPKETMLEKKKKNNCKIRKFGCLEEKWQKLTFCGLSWDKAENCVLCGRHITTLIPS